MITEPTGGNAIAMLGSYVERIEALETEKRGLADDIKDVYTEVKAAGLSAKHIRALVRERRQSPAARREFEETMDQYRHALGMLDGTPLGQAAVRRVSE